MPQRVKSVAIIGPDGSGKTTITQLLMERTSIPFHYVYMGVSWSSSNVLLPTTRLIQLLRRHKNRKEPAVLAPKPFPGDDDTPRKSFVARWLSLANKLGEEWYRQLLSYYHQFRGKVLLYDRHFVFDFSLESKGDASLREKLHRFLIQNFYPEPKLVICLDAPVELLFERKQEFTRERLQWLREGYLSLQKTFPRIHYVDASQPLETVYQEVICIIERHFEGAKVKVDSAGEATSTRLSGS